MHFHNLSIATQPAAPQLTVSYFDHSRKNISHMRTYQIKKNCLDRYGDLFYHISLAILSTVINFVFLAVQKYWKHNSLRITELTYIYFSGMSKTLWELE